MILTHKGINAYHGNASAALVCDGTLIAAVEEERFNRVKYAAGFPAEAIRYCLKTGGITLAEVDHVAVPRNPYARLATKLFYALRMPSFARERLRVMSKFTGIPAALAAAFDYDPEKIKAAFHRIEHHQAHLASSYFVSPFEHAALLSADGLGDFASTMWGVGRGAQMEIEGAIAFPHSLGLFYSAVTQYLGFLKFGDEYKVMGLGAYGEPRYLRRRVSRCSALSLRQRPVWISAGLGLLHAPHYRTRNVVGGIRQNASTFGKMFSDALPKKLGAPARDPDEPLEQRHPRYGRFAAGATGRSLPAGDAEEAGGEDWREGGVPGGRRGVQLRREWKDFRCYSIRTGIRASRCRRCRSLRVGAAFHVWHQMVEQKTRAPS